MSSSTQASECAMNKNVPHVLVVDDCSVTRKFVKQALCGDYKVTAVESGKIALELLGAETDRQGFGKNPKVDLIVTDYDMPEITGYDILKRVKESSSLKGIPVVIMSAEDIQDRKSRCLEKGAEDFLLKPLKQTDLSRICKCILQQSKKLVKLQQG